MANELIIPAVDLPRAAARQIADQINGAILARGHCYCALSGGSSPKPMLADLASMSVSWQRVTLLLVDERYTEDPAQQNQTLMQWFVQQLPKPPAQVVWLLTPGLGLVATVDQANTAVAHFPQQLDVVVLGMGLDGHTASLFPDAEDYPAAMASRNRYVPVHPTTAPHPRISMSFDWLAATRHPTLYIPGPEKLQRLRQILAEPQPVSPLQPLDQALATLDVFSSED
ncbi:MAG: 6-phosphogluconolactonase [Pseudomonadales bacterium]|nr:6-phosphogluconolactonase [Pseudomonadales bacterium]